MVYDFQSFSIHFFLVFLFRNVFYCGKIHNIKFAIFSFLMIFVFSIIVGLQCSVSFLLYSKVPSHTHTHTHTHTYTFFFSYYPPACSITIRYSSQCYYTHRISLPIHSKGSSLPLLTPNSQSIPLSPPQQPQVFSPSPWISFLWKGSFVSYIRLQI